jgi:hypothetical protein
MQVYLTEATKAWPQIQGGDGEARDVLSRARRLIRDEGAVAPNGTYPVHILKERVLFR